MEENRAKTRLWPQKRREIHEAIARGDLPEAKPGSMTAFMVEAARIESEDYAPDWLDVEGVDWVVARVVTGSERRVVFDLKTRGFRAYSPLHRRKVFRARAPGSEKRGPKIAARAAFAGYVFVGAEAMRGIGRGMHERVLDVVSRGCEPLRVPSPLIGAINEREVAGGFDDFAAPSGNVVKGARPVWVRRSAPREFELGQLVRVTSGPFASFYAAVVGLPDDLRVQIELAIFGRATSFPIEACSLEKVLA